MSNTCELIGQKFGDLVIESADSSGSGFRVFCRCKCGISRQFELNRLKSGHSTTCGNRSCRTRPPRQPKWNPPAGYNIWAGIKQRCHNPKEPKFSYYGGRGISVCERWQNSFADFIADMGEPPQGYTIERIDNDGNYNPGNCRWATKKAQQNNKRTNVILAYQGRSQTVSQWADELGIKPNTVTCRMRRGWTAEQALGLPIGEWNRANCG